MPLTPPGSPRSLRTVDNTASPFSSPLMQVGTGAISAATQRQHNVSAISAPPPATLSLGLGEKGKSQILLTYLQPFPKKNTSTQMEKSASQPEWLPLKKLTFQSAVKKGATIDSRLPTKNPGKSDFPAWLHASPWESIQQSLTVVTGLNGSGKSQLLKLIAREMGPRAIYKDATSFLQPNISSTDTDKVIFPEIRTDIQKDQLIKDIRENIKLIHSDSKISLFTIRTEAFKIGQKIVIDEGREASEQVSDEIILRYINNVSMPDLSNIQNAFSVLSSIFYAYTKKREECIKQYRDIAYFQTLKSRYQSQAYANPSKTDYLNPNNPYVKFSLFIAVPKNLDHLIDYGVTEVIGKPYWEDINALFAINGLDLKMDFKVRSRSQPEIYFTRHDQPIDILELSAGEQLILEMFVWQFYTSGLSNTGLKRIEESKIEMLLLDEPDRHFDPKLCKLFISCLEYISKNNKVQIIMTTHRTDTLAYVPEGSIFTIKRDTAQGPARIEPTPRLTALFKLTPNLREITNFHIKVHTESHDDATVYESIYKFLLELSNRMWSVNRNDPSNKREILSRRFQLTFYSLAFEKIGSGGGCQTIPPVVQREKVAIDHRSEKPNSRSIYEGSMTYPLGLIDADTDLDETQNIKANSTRITNKFDAIRSQLFFTKRYSLENYIYDPVFLFSLLSTVDIEEWCTKDVLFKEHASACKEALEAISIAGSTYPLDSLQATFNEYFKHFIGEFVSTKVMNLKKIDGEPLKRFKTQTSPDDYNKIYGYLKMSNALSVATNSTLSISSTATTSNKSVAKTKTKLTNKGDPKPINILETLSRDLGIELIDGEADESKKEKIVQGLMQAQLTTINILSPDGTRTYSIQYPGFFIYARGHNLEEFVQKTFAKNENADGDNFKRWLIDKVATSKEPLTLPMDLVNVIRDLNDRVRAQARAVLKPSA